MLRLQIDGAALECERFNGGAGDDHGDAGDHHGGGGDRAPLVFLHEGLGSLTQWRGVPAELCSRSGRAGVAYARAGHGRSQPPQRRRTAEYMHHEAQVVLPEVIARFDLHRPILVGHSDGASIALIHAAQPDASLGGLVLLAPHVMVEDCTVAGIAAAGVAYRGDGLRAALARHHDRPDALFGAWHDVWLDPSFRRWDLRPLLGSISVPVLLVQGRDDQYGTMAQLDAIEAGVRGPRRRLELSDCGHSPQLEQRAATVDAIVSFLDDVA